ncbi:hypothetical protein [Roseomonas fluvialis]|uniref:Uncharacterized protein n=1 Tax=Roseomonas fluvialis TaxID=1750527 RepID=A0ABM7Y571_9PROT|nr:hypothetical protein [Roseomonas fluvialis]BDG73018.1 hypothetical protein Rmf_29470 [Roseomonas fluvialis]
MRAAGALALLLLLAAPAGAQEGPRVPLRAGSHADHGRLVFDWPTRVPYTAQAEDGQVVLRFDAPGSIDLAAARRPPRNVLAVEQADGAIVVRFAPGARTRHFRLGNRIVVDVLDAPAGEAAADAPAPRAARQAAAPAAAPPRAQAPAAASAGRPAAAPAVASPAPPAATSSAPPAATSPARQAPPAAPAADTAPAARAATTTAPAPPRPASDTAPTRAAAPTAPGRAADAARPGAAARPGVPPSAPAARASEPSATRNDATAAQPAEAAAAVPTASLAAADARPVRLLDGAPAFAVPADAEAGLSLFRRGDWVLAVFDRPLRLDLSALARHAVFGSATVATSGEATVLRLRLAPPAVLQARRDGAAWVIEARPEPAPDAAPLRAVPEPGPPARVALTGGLTPEAVGTSIAITDPETGEALLVGTLRRAGPGIGIARRLPELEILPSMMGAVVLPRSDRVVLRPRGEGFAVEAAGRGLALGAAPGRDPPAEAMALSRLLDLPVAPVPALMERLRTQLLAINETPPLARGVPRRAVAETLLALGMPQEAQAMVGLGLREDPHAQADARLLLAQGAAALLSGRIEEARVLADPRLPSSDELMLWRGLLAAAQGDPRAAAPALAAGAPLVLAYPEALRARLLPPLLETLATGDEAPRAARLLAEAGDAPGLELTRAMLAEAAGRTEDALRLYEDVIAGRDRRQRADALKRVAELRLSTGATDAAGAADALDQALFAWRGGTEELSLRRRIAALRMASGNGQAAFAMLDEAGRVFPDQARALRPELAEAFAVALETAPPLAATTLFDAHPDLLPEGERGEAAVLLLAERLAALDLAGRAAALLESAAARATPQARAAIGARLAALRMAEGDAAAALAALDRSRADDLAEALVGERARLRARALARRGDRAAAEQALAVLGAAGAEARAELRAEAQDWAGAAAAQREHLDHILPAPPAPLGQAPRAALARAAAYAALAGEEDALVALRAAHGERMAGGPLAEAFDLLTADPLRGIADLPRLQRELGLLRVLPTRLEALRAGVQVAR